jgi:hypothetical protein
MNRMNVKAGVMVAAMMCTSLALAEDTVESVSVKLSGGSTGVGVGANWGGGILTFEGYQYPFSISGLTIGDVGVNRFTGSGSVHNLERPEDFSGNYAGLGAGLTVAGGGSLITMRNQNGVTINLVLTTRGLKVGLGGGGINLEIPASGFAAVRALKAAEAAAARADEAVHRIEAAAGRVEAAAQRTERIAEEMDKQPSGHRARVQRVAPKA